MELILIDVGSWLIAIGLTLGFIVVGAWVISVLIDVFMGDKK
jgi:hypothetical protein